MSGGRPVLFVCLHGAAKSVLAAADFERLARERGLDLRAEFAGTEPDPAIAPRVAQALLAEGVDLGDRRPRRVTRADVERASRVVAFGCDLARSPPGRVSSSGTCRPSATISRRRARRSTRGSPGSSTRFPEPAPSR